MKTPTRLLLTIIASTSLSLAARATPAVTLTGATLWDVGGWFSLPNNTYYQQSLFRLYAIAGSDRNGPILNPSGGLDIPLNYGNSTFVLVGDSVSGAYVGDPSPRTLQLMVNGPTGYQFADQMGAASIVAYSDGRLGNTFTTADGLTNVSLTQFTYVEPSGYDRVSVNSVSPDGYSDSYATITISVQPNLAGYQALIAQLKQTIADDDALVASLQTQLATANTQVTSLQAQLDTANTTIANLNAQLAAATAAKANLQSQLDAANASNASLQTANANLQSQLDAANTMIANLNAQLVAANTAKANLQSQLDAANATISTLNTQLAAATATNATLTSQLTAANNQIASLQSALGTANTQIAQLQSALTAANATIAAQQSTIASLQATIAQMSSSETSLGTSLGTIFNDPSFTVPGATPTAQLTNLVNAIGQLNHGQQQALYFNLGGKKK